MVRLFALSLVALFFWTSSGVALASECDRFLVRSEDEKVVPIARTAESFEKWRSRLEDQTLYEFKDTDPSSEEIVLYNWGDGYYSTRSITQGIKGRALKDLTKRANPLSMGLYTANNPFGRVGHGDTLMEVVVYKDRRPVDENGIRKWVPITNNEFSVDVNGQADTITRAGGPGEHEDFVILDPRVIKRLSWPSKDYLLREIRGRLAKIDEEEALRKASGMISMRDMKIGALSVVMEQVFSAGSFTAQDRLEFLKAGGPEVEALMRHWDIGPSNIWSSVHLTESLSPGMHAGLRGVDNLFKALFGEQIDFLNFDVKDFYFSLTHLIEASRNLAPERVELLKKLLPKDGVLHLDLQRFLSLAVAVAEKDSSRAQELFSALEKSLETAKTQYSPLAGWTKLGKWKKIYEAQKREYQRARSALATNPVQ